MVTSKNLNEISSPIEPSNLVVSIADLLIENNNKYADRIAFAEKNEQGVYTGIKWDELFDNITCIAGNLKKEGFKKGEKIVLFCSNSLNMLQAELAIMASGGIAVPIFVGFKKATAELLIDHSDADYLIIEGKKQYQEINPKALGLKKIWSFDNINNDADILPFSRLLQKHSEHQTDFNAHNLSSQDICLNMYTSGTMGAPKCVQLTHQNILSQQAAIKKILKINEKDRFLSYLPWHHSFGGIFELFSALYNGATYHLESSYGKDASQIFENWQLVKPTVFFSVPKVYQSLYELAKESKKAENTFFNSGLKFIFTAAASLPQRLSDEFENRGIDVVEGWGLTETSPCCTLTDPTLKREPGVVGKPIPGVSIRIAEDSEIQVKGPNVMVSYYKNDEANKDIFTDDGWYKTGDVGEITDNGLKLISRKDRIFKLSNGEKVIPTDIEKAIEMKCSYVQYVVVAGSGEQYPIALIFPNKNLFTSPNYDKTPEEGCFCPKNVQEFGKCLTGCLEIANDTIQQKFAKVKSAAILSEELSIENSTLTPSMKIAPKKVIEKYKKYLLKLYGEQIPDEEDVYIIDLNKNI